MQPKSIHADEAILNFADRDSWQQWLTGNHDSSPGAWLRLAKKGADSRSISHAEALEVALCYGWIDAQKKPESARTWLRAVYSAEQAQYLVEDQLPEGDRLDREWANEAQRPGRSRPGQARRKVGTSL